MPHVTSTDVGMPGIDASPPLTPSRESQPKVAIKVEEVEPSLYPAVGYAAPTSISSLMLPVLNVADTASTSTLLSLPTAPFFPDRFMNLITGLRARELPAANDVWARQPFCLPGRGLYTSTSSPPPTPHSSPGTLVQVSPTQYRKRSGRWENTDRRSKKRKHY
ncbi:hypothetical protein PAXINDRAFT_16921 [Paxillus involutus ATCC 200175]|uniref:Uncharacterized protein n=1 Tax=Paxillus involutus ATCC 200175 TaxID=664439 RepID=A0A0C9TGU6_PAXIN|nr:hypothetical protein PAXINDRAFT_16921 [Paxillus involutus ATCC 200175]